MGGWIGLKKRKDVPERYRPLIGLTADEARTYLRAVDIEGVSTGGTVLTDVAPVSVDEKSDGRTLVWTPWILTVYVREDGRIVDVGDAG